MKVENGSLCLGSLGIFGHRLRLEREASLAEIFFLLHIFITVLMLVVLLIVVILH
jgi:hypothetical protein